jgi:Flp pilus assembly pilin Flp
MLRNTLVQLWNDESGAVIATEYLMLGSVVALGTAAGMAEVRDSVIDEYKDMGQSIRETRQGYSIPIPPRGAKTRGPAASGTPGMPETTTFPTTQRVSFSYPTP